MHPDIDRYRVILQPSVVAILRGIVSRELNPLSDKDIVSVLDDNEELLHVYINVVDDITELEKRIVACIQEYFFHIFNELGGIENLHGMDVVIFAGSYFDDPNRSVLNVTKAQLTKNDWYWIEFSYGWL